VDTTADAEGHLGLALEAGLVREAVPVRTHGLHVNAGREGVVGLSGAVEGGVGRSCAVADRAWREALFEI
jgi:hypothetical protein